MSNINTIEANTRVLNRIYTVTFKKGKGSYLWDVTGKRYLDALSGIGVNALGNDHPVIRRGFERYLSDGSISQTLDLVTPIRGEFMEKLVQFIGIHSPGFAKDMNILFCAPAGSDAIDAATKIAKIYTKRSGIISFTGAFHGTTQSNLNLTCNTLRKKNLNHQTSGTQYMPFPFSYRSPMAKGCEVSEQEITKTTIEYLEYYLDDVDNGINKPAALIVEPVQGEAGMIPAPIEWLRQIRRITKERGILLILDEIQSGVGRTGRGFAFQYADIEPDILCISKGIGGGQPLAVVCFNKRYNVMDPGDHLGTFRGNQLAFYTASEMLGFMMEQNLWINAEKIGSYILEQLKALKNDYLIIGDVRGKGLMIGIEIIDPTKPHNKSYDTETAKALQIKLFDNCLMMTRGGRYGSTIRLLPPITFTKQDADELIAIFAKSLYDIKYSN